MRIEAAPIMSEGAVQAPAAAFAMDCCPLCDKHCPLDALSCGKGKRLAAGKAAGV